MSLVWVEGLLFTDGSRVAIPKNGAVVFVGPNNSGKSLALRVLASRFWAPNYLQHSIIKGIEVGLTADTDSVIEFLEPYRLPATDRYELEDRQLPSERLPDMWRSIQKDGTGLYPAGTALLTALTTSTRLTDCNSVQNIHLGAQRPTHPLHRMLMDRQLEYAASNIVRDAFKKDLVIDRGAGLLIPLYVGHRPELLEGEERADLSYAKRVRELELLEHQGDGIKSFVSMIIRVQAETRPIIMIDEPEAFLHPPQARLLGRHLATADRQALIATHSSDILRGLFSAGPHIPVTVVRLVRKNGTATARALVAEQVAELWKDPILRFSNVLDGLFHDGVILTESDADCRFYEALVGAVEPPEARHDLHYCYSGGKDRLHVVIRALVQIGVPVATVVDFDVLNDAPTLQRIFEAAGGCWTTIERDWQTVKRFVESRGSGFLGSEQFVAEMGKLLGQCKTGEAVPKEVLATVRRLARQASPWDHCKGSGLHALRGDAFNAATRLLGDLKSHGVFVVPVGELEGFKRSIAPHGPRWVEEVLRGEIDVDPELHEAREFGRALLQHFSEG